MEMEASSSQSQGNIQEDVSFVTFPSGLNQSKTIIVHMNPKPTSASSTKLKSLLPKSLQSETVKSEISLQSFQLAPESNAQSNNFQNNYSTFSSNESLISQQYEEDVKPEFVPQAHVEGNPSTTMESVDTLLQRLGSTLSAAVSGVETYTVAEAVGDRSTTSVAAVPLSEVPESSMLEHISTSVSDLATSSPAIIPSQVSIDEQDKEQDVIKKTMVEAFVKMVVCRKVTVQRVHAKTGQVIDTNIKTEEEEPVILGVDCVETTEDLMSGTNTEAGNGSGSTDLASSKWGASLDGGLKFLSAVSESRQKIGKNLLKEKLLKSSPAKAVGLARVSDLRNRKLESTSENARQHAVQDSSGIQEPDTKSVTQNDSDGDWNEEFNDDSEDYVPNLRTKHKATSASSSNHKANLKLHRSSFNKMGHSKVKEECEKNLKNGSNVINRNTDTVIFLQRKRGRKRKWDNALGLAPNLRICQFCNKNFSNVQACAKHMKKGKCVSSIYCFICSKPFSNEQDLEKHLASHGNQARSRVFECKDCSRTYHTRAGYDKHFKMGTCLKRDNFEDGCTGDYKCDLCDTWFSTEGYLKLHNYKVHENPKDTHTCPDCGKKFYSTLGFSKHRSGRPCTEPLRCKICGKTYSSKAKESFKIHMKHHKSEVTGITFECDECGRSYMTQMALTKHKLSHTGIKPYKCDICGKEFAMRYMVKDHARMHTGERPYLCSLCGSAFSNKGHLGRHVRSHENGTLNKRGRPKKTKESDENSNQETELKMINLSQTLQNFDGQAIQVVDGQLFESHSSGTPMIIQADNNTIIIAEGWPNASSSGTAITIPNPQEIASITSNIVASSAP